MSSLGKTNDFFKKALMTRITTCMNYIFFSLFRRFSISNWPVQCPAVGQPSLSGLTLLFPLVCMGEQYPHNFSCLIQISIRFSSFRLTRGKQIMASWPNIAWYASYSCKLRMAFPSFEMGKNKIQNGIIFHDM